MLLRFSMTSKLGNTMSTPSNPGGLTPKLADNAASIVNGVSDRAPGDAFSPEVLTRMANELFNALPGHLARASEADATGNPVLNPTLPASALATVPAFPPEISLPSDPHFAGVPGSAGPAAAAPVTAPIQMSPPVILGAPASALSSGTPAPFSFLHDIRPAFEDDESSQPSLYPAARPVTDFAAREPTPVPDTSGLDEQPALKPGSFSGPPSPTLPGSFGAVDSSTIPAFSFMEEARPLFSSTPSIPGPVPANLDANQANAGNGTGSADPFYTSFESPFEFTKELRSITPEQSEVRDAPGIEPHVPEERSLSSFPFDAEALKHDFPILRERIHGRPLVWLDNAATTQKPQSVIDRLNYFYEHENSNVHRAAHELAARSTDAYESAREKVRRFLNASSSREIVFVRGATEGINLVAQSWGRQNIQKDDEVVITWLEHHANIVPWQMLCAEKGAHLRIAPVDSTGQIILSEYEKLLGPRTRLVAFPQVSNALGVVTPAQAIIEAAHRYGAKVLLDGAQSVSHMRTDVQALDCDFFVFSGHKVFAPTGIGVVYGKPEILEHMPPWQGGGNMIQDVTFERTVYQPAPQRFEAGTGNIADAVGLGAAIDYLDRVGIENISRHEHTVLLYATESLLQIPGLCIIGTTKEKAGVISFVMDGFRTEEIGDYLNQNGIAVRSGHHCAQPILRRFGLESTVRASLALYNTLDDIDALARALWNLRFGRVTLE